ncbi:MAG TPA: Wzz/FepE/Etk N-terminal domain-containing protein, partial [Usitatibacter sp.]|nr:Wzz/FepE/Etk N-terminal domain-containing protein [Usitatibacter sp.]
MNDLTLQERLQALGSAGAPGERGETPEIVEYWRAIAKRRWSILGLTLAVAILATLVVMNVRPTYRGMATLLIEQGKSRVVSIEEIYSQGLIQREYFQTQVEILKSEELARKVVQRLKLTTHPDYDPRAVHPGVLSAMLAPVLGRDEARAPTEEDVLKAVVQRFRRDLHVELVRNSQLVQVTFESYDRQLAAA